MCASWSGEGKEETATRAEAVVEEQEAGEGTFARGCPAPAISFRCALHFVVHIPGSFGVFHRSRLVVPSRGFRVSPSCIVSSATVVVVEINETRASVQDWQSAGKGNKASERQAVQAIPPPPSSLRPQSLVEPLWLHCEPAGKRVSVTAPVSRGERRSYAPETRFDLRNPHASSSLTSSTRSSRLTASSSSLTAFSSTLGGSMRGFFSSGDSRAGPSSTGRFLSSFATGETFGVTCGEVGGVEAGALPGGGGGAGPAASSS